MFGRIAPGGAAQRRTFLLQQRLSKNDCWTRRFTGG